VHRLTIFIAQKDGWLPRFNDLVRADVAISRAGVKYGQQRF
jgi:hypothetical protein